MQLLDIAHAPMEDFTQGGGSEAFLLMLISVVMLVYAAIVIVKLRKQKKGNAAWCSWQAVGIRKKVYRSIVR